MGSTSRPEGTPLSAQLLTEPYRFDFFQAVRLAERMACAAGASACQPVGYEGPPQKEAVRFRVLPSLAFPANALHEVRVAPGGQGAAQGLAFPLEFVVTFLGLTGPLGALPHHYTALLLARIRRKDFGLRDFFDLFHHRILSLFYRAWEKYRFPIGYERAQRAADGREDLFTQVLFCLVGLGPQALRHRNRFDDDVWLYYAGLFAHHPRNAISLEILLADCFQVPVEVRQFQGQWLRLEEEDRSRLPSAHQPAGLNNHLGQNVVIGERVWNIESKFRVRIGPLRYGQFRRYLPSADRLGALSQLVRCYVGPQFDFDVQLVLMAQEVPRCRLGGDGDPSYLGWNTWIGSIEFDHDVDDAVFAEKVEPWSS